MRESIKKQLIDALESKTDNANLKWTSAQLSVDLENAIYELTGKNSKDKAYREKSKKIVGRIKGARNNNIRNILKAGTIEVSEFTSMPDKQLDDDSTFNKYGNSADTTDTKKPKGGMKPPVINIPHSKIDLTAGNLSFYS